MAMSPTQQKLFPGSPAKPTIEHLDDSGSDEADCPGLSNLIHVENFWTMSKAFAKSPQDGSPDGLRRLRRHRASGCLRESYNLQSDESLFLALNRHYSQSTNKIVRYLSLRGVVKIHYVKFVFAHRGPDIEETNNWPPERHCPPWTYKGCPAKKKDMPLVGQSLLMHLWQFPSHADQQSYHSHRFKSSRVARHILCYFQSMILGKFSGRWRGRAEEGTQRQNLGNAEETRGNTISSSIAAVGADIEMANSGHKAVLRNPETQAESKASSYIFLRTPKKLGEKLLPNDLDPPEGWCMYFEEGLKVSRLFMFILFLYLSGTLVFAIVWYRAFGMAGPQSGFGAFGVSAWMVGLMSIITTVWFKWAE